MHRNRKHRPAGPARAAVLAAAGLAGLVAAAGSAGARDDPGAAAAGRQSTTIQITRALDGGQPDGPSTNAVVSNDKRYVRAIAFESEASNLVRGDTNGVKDVFVVRRGNSADNTGSYWAPGDNVLISRTRSGAPADGPSFSASIDGSFHTAPTCVGFLSAATNIVEGDTNGRVDAFVAGIDGGPPRRVSVPGGRESAKATTAVAVSGDCSAIAFVTGGKLYVSKRGGRPKRVRHRGHAADPSFSTGLRNDLVFGARGGVYLALNGTGRPKLVGRHGRNPAYNDIKRRTVVYEKKVGRHRQIAYHDIGKPERIISRGRRRGNRDSHDPVIGNSGYYVTFESTASNLRTDGTGYHDRGHKPDIYLYTDTRKTTIRESLGAGGGPLPGGAKHPGMSFYANYIVFDASTGAGAAGRQVLMRYLGGI